MSPYVFQNYLLFLILPSDKLTRPSAGQTIPETLQKQSVALCSVLRPRFLLEGFNGLVINIFAIKCPLEEWHTNTHTDS